MEDLVMEDLAISGVEDSIIDALAERLTKKKLTKTKVKGLNLNPIQIERIRRACIWGYTPEQICEMFPFADLSFVLEQRKKFNHRLRARFQIPIPCRVHMCMIMKKEGLTASQISKLLGINAKTVGHYLTGYAYSTTLEKSMRHWTEILESLNGPKPLNVNSPIYKPTKKTARADENNRSILDKEKLASQDYKHRLQAVGH